MSDDFDKGFTAPTSGIVRFGKKGDVVRGTFLESKVIPDGDYGPYNRHSIIADAGFFHNREEGKVADTKTDVIKGDRYSFNGHMTMDDKVAQAKPGQLIVVRYLGLVDSKKKPGKQYNSYEVKLGGMDPAFDVGASPDDDIPFV